MARKRNDWKLVTEFPVVEYQCGARAGDSLRLRKDIVVRNHLGNPTGQVHRADEIWQVLRGTESPPTVVWLRQPDGKSHTWDDDPGLWEWFERIAPKPADTGI